MVTHLLRAVAQVSVSHIEQRLALDMPEFLPGVPFVIYGDPAYRRGMYLTCGYNGAHVTPAQQRFNRDMSSVRETVEWGFGRIATYFAYVPSCVSETRSGRG